MTITMRITHGNSELERDQFAILFFDNPFEVPATYLRSSVCRYTIMAY